MDSIRCPCQVGVLLKTLIRPRRSRERCGGLGIASFSLILRKTLTPGACSRDSSSTYP